MADIIQLLPDHVANQIAAGEVVQRPASVVKELLENAIDAEATLVKLIIKDAGKTLIQVIDNGDGMSTTDARLSFERHATSKIKTAEDLFQLHTKGFRGEALASIAAIAHVNLKTKQERDEVGTEITIEGSTIVSQEIVVTPKGTSVSVKNLFFNIPARRNFLKSNTVELRHVIDEFHRVALAHPKIHFTFYNNGSEMFNLPVSNYRQRIVNIFGAKTNEKLVPVEEATEVVKIVGFVGKPEFAKKTRGEQYFFVNERFIKSAYLNHAILSAFEGLIRPGAHPSYFLNLTVDPQSIDINIHPTKTEIKFNDEHTLYAILRSSVKHSLGQFNIAPVLDFEHDSNLDTPYTDIKSVVDTPKIEVDRNFNPFQESHSMKGQASAFKRPSSGHWDSLYIGLESKKITPQADFKDMHIEGEEAASSLFEAEASVEQDHKTYQFHNKYIISAIKSGLLVIDQFRAHQRILYEEFLKNLTVKEGVSQQLLFPLQIHLPTPEVEIIKQLKEDLEHTGFVFSSIGDELIEIMGVPLNVPESEVSIILEQLINDVQHEVPEASFSAIDLLAKSMAKSLAIKAGQPLKKDEQEYIVNKLFACKEPNVTPSNRLTFVTVGIDELDKKFI
ncbi:DNA mismatch repair endonuclease MutL [Aestuariivivens sediminicola]|uniref:DNA mismatch repair endonuclease MutL n=1 Tax=Aestuariivivens sediminicola TaxID=2913560 RepID=UPI001F5A8873|nr:DNA mismatch repair endonuclease MutL [Aestuariivivens sediminicola]